MQFKKINPFLWAALAGYLLFMASVYLKHDLPFFLGMLGVSMMVIGGIGWVGIGAGIFGSDENDHG